HPLCADKRSDDERRGGAPLAVVRVVDFTRYGCDLRCTFWSKDAGDGYAVMCDARLAIKKQFDEQGIAWPRTANTLHENKP
ncbi:MAG: hypothetical protein PHO66_08515, partial [Eubacteriales bacterium]|nr:hypothetical protein [Eubacteriales bacterium]